VTTDGALTARVLTGSASNDATKREIEKLFAEFGFEARVESEIFMSVGPVGVMECIALSAPVLAFFTAMTTKAGEDAYLALKGFCKRMLNARRRSNGRETSIQLEDTKTGLRIELSSELPDNSWRQLLGATRTYLSAQSAGAGSPTGPTLKWSSKWNRWIAHVRVSYEVSLGSGRVSFNYRTIARPFPPMVSRVHAADPDHPPRRDLGSEGKRLRTYIEKNVEGPVIPWQRAAIVDEYHRPVPPGVSEIAGSFFVSDALILAVVNDFEGHKFAMLRPDFDGGAAGTIPDRLRSEIIDIARSAPGVYGRHESSWSIQALAEFLVGEGLLEDVGHTILDEFLADSGVLLDGD
jgi:hypothetical protein